MFGQKQSQTAQKNNKEQASSGKSKFGFVPNKDAIKMKPCLIVLETFQIYLQNLELEQVSLIFYCA